jgi:heme/copper-type cytochrome/quinol oxidase subunit 2
MQLISLGTIAGAVGGGVIALLAIIIIVLILLSVCLIKKRKVNKSVKFDTPQQDHQYRMETFTGPNINL